MSQAGCHVVFRWQVKSAAVMVKLSINPVFNLCSNASNALRAMTFARTSNPPLIGAYAIGRAGELLIFPALAMLVWRFPVSDTLASFKLFSRVLVSGNGFWMQPAARKRQSNACPHTTVLTCLCTALAVLLLASKSANADNVEERADCVGPVSAVRFEGNKVTLDETLLQRLEIRAGGVCSPAELEAGRQAIMNTGLFKSVEAHFDPDTAVVSFIVKERIYRFLLPRFSRSADGDIKIGGQLRFDNMLGRNHKMRITARRVEGSGGNTAGNSLSARYQIPRFFNSNFGLSMSVAGARHIEMSVVDFKEVGQVKRSEHGASILLTRYLQEQATLSGWKISLGLVTGQRTYRVLSGNSGNLVSGMSTELRLAGTYNGVQLEEYRRRGREYGVELGAARKSLAGDFSYTRLTLFYRGYAPLKNERVLENLNFQIRLGAASDAAFGEASFQVGGGRSLRGFDKNLLRGNNMAVFNGEYLRSFAGKPRLRWAVISDLAAVKDDKEWRLGSLRASLGTGLRWKIRSLVNTDLNLDLAYGFGDGGGEARFYFGTKVVF